MTIPPTTARHVEKEATTPVRNEIPKVSLGFIKTYISPARHHLSAINKENRSDNYKGFDPYKKISFIFDTIFWILSIHILYLYAQPEKKPFLTRQVFC